MEKIMDNNQPERKSINLSKEKSDERPMREAYPVYRDNVDTDSLQRQEYRNSSQPQQRTYQPVYRDNADNDILMRQEYRNSPQQQPSYQQTATQYQEPVNYNIPPVQPMNMSNPPAARSNDMLDHYYDYDDPQQEPNYNDPNGYQQNPNYAGQNGGYQQNPNYANQQNMNYANMNVFVQQQESMKYCKYCGQRIPSDAVVCTHCGRQVEALNGAMANVNINTQPQRIYPQETFDAFNTSDKSKSTSLILAALGFLGLGGLHRFYSGKILSGFIYLCTGGLCGIGTFVDILKIASNTFTDGAGRVIRK